MLHSDALPVTQNSQNVSRAHMLGRADILLLLGLPHSCAVLTFIIDHHHHCDYFCDDEVHLCVYVCVCVCVCVCARARARVCDNSFVWLGLFMCMLIRYLGFMGTFFFLIDCSVGCLSMTVWTPAVLFACMHVFCIFVSAPVQRN